MLNNKIIVVTGAAGLLGQHFVRCIAEKGAIVVATDINVESLNSLFARNNGGLAGCIEIASLDITNKDSISKVISATHKKHGRIDAVINNAYPRNKNYGKKLEDIAYPDFCENINMHLGGYFLVAQLFCIYFKNQGFGNLINMASIYGYTAPRFEVYADTLMTMPVEYAAIKSAVIQLTRYFAQYYKEIGVRINCLSPGGILDKQPASFLMAYKSYAGTKGMLEPKDLIGALLFLLSDDSRFMTGQNLIIDDGFSL